MGIMTNQDKIIILQARIDAINIGLEWLNNNPSIGDIPEGKKSTQDQIDELFAEKNIYLQILEDLV